MQSEARKTGSVGYRGEFTAFERACLIPVQFTRNIYKLEMPNTPRH